MSKISFEELFEGGIGCFVIIGIISLSLVPLALVIFSLLGGCFLFPVNVAPKLDRLFHV